MNPDDDFYVVVTSNSSTQRYTNNKSVAFTYLIPGGYCLEGNWQVSLWRLEIPSKLKPSTGSSSSGPLLVYTDLITDTLIGDITAPLLSIVPVNKDQPISFTPTHLEYHKLKVKLLNEISILLVNLEGKQIELDDNNAHVLLELHFVRKTI